MKLQGKILTSIVSEIVHPSNALQTQKKEQAERFLSIRTTTVLHPVRIGIIRKKIINSRR